MIPTLIGLVALVGAATVLALVMRSEALATRVGAFGQRIVTPVSRWLRRSSAPDVTAAVLEFRHSSIGLLRTRWWRLTLWVVLYNFGQFLLLLLCVRAVGEGADQLGWIEVFAAFAFARLLETIPFTPSGVGFVETGAVAALIGFGGSDAASAAAVFLFRGLHLPGRDPRRRRGLGRVGHQALVAPPHRLRRRPRQPQESSGATAAWRASSWSRRSWPEASTKSGTITSSTPRPPTPPPARRTPRAGRRRRRGGPRRRRTPGRPRRRR